MANTNTNTCARTAWPAASTASRASAAPEWGQTAPTLPRPAALFAHYPLPTWLIGDAGQVVAANTLAHQQMRPSAGVLHFGDLLAGPRDRALLDDQLQCATAGVPMAILPVMMRDAAGLLLVGDLHLSRVSDAGAAPLQAAVFIDRTEQWLCGRELDQAHQLADAAEARRAVQLRQLGHELRTPLGAISGFTQLIQLHLSEPAAADRSDIEGFLGHIADATQHLLKLADDQMAAPAAATGRVPVPGECLSLLTLLQQALALTQNRFRHSGVHLSSALPDPGLRVMGDALNIKQVLCNLLENAAKYTPRGGRVMLVARLVDHRVRISVSDNGPGLGADQQRHLFERFNRLGAEHGPVDGLGLGLALSRELVEAMSGEIGCISEPGRGAEFWFTLPAALPD